MHQLHRRIWSDIYVLKPLGSTFLVKPASLSIASIVQVTLLNSVVAAAGELFSTNSPLTTSVRETEDEGMPARSSLSEIKLLLDCVDYEPNLTVFL